MTVTELEEFFNSITLPQTISIKQGEEITDVPAFVKSHLEIAKAHRNVPAFSAFYDRLYILMETLKYQGEAAPEQS